MTKNLRAFKATIVLMILLLSSVFVVMPTGSARILKLTPYLAIEYDVNQTNQVITPLQKKLNIELKVLYEVSGAAVTLPGVPEFLAEQQKAAINLEVDTSSLPSYCSASIANPTVQAEISTQLKQAAPNPVLTVSVNENAPGFMDFTVRVKAHANKVNGLLVEIPEIDSAVDVRVTPNYAALISIEEPKGNYKEIGPLDTADFDIKVTNLGNAPTEVTFEVINLPKGWSASIMEALTLGSAVAGGEDGSVKTATLRIKPPYSFGYHNDRQTIQVRVTPTYYRDASLIGKVYTLDFTVQSRGFSTPGFEGALVFIAMMIFLGFVYYNKRKK